VHYLDPHAPYSPPGAWAGKFQGDERFDPSRKIEIAAKPKQQMLGIGKSQVVDGHTDLAFYVARYDAEIAYTDHQIGLLLEAMGKRKLLAKTLTAFTADHGESLGDHGYYFDHGRFSFDSCLRVPLILHYPGVLAPRVDREPAELIDLAPTLIEATGLPLANGAWMQGRTLTPRLRGLESGAKDPIYAYSEAGYGLNNHWLKVVRDRRFKLVFAEMLRDQRWIGGEGVKFVLYDLLNDPGETKNVADRFPE